MGTRERPRRRLRTFLRLDDEQQRPKRRRSTARREPAPDPVEEYSGEELLDAWAGGWPESLRTRYAEWGCPLPPLPKRRG